MDERLKHRLAGFLTVDIPEGPGRYRLAGQLLKLVAAGALLVFLMTAAAFTFAVGLFLLIGILGAAFLTAATPMEVPVPPWEWSTLAPLAIPVVGLLAVGGVVTLAMNHVVLWWARGLRRGLWAARAAGVGAILLGGGGLGRAAFTQGLLGSSSLLGIALAAAGLAIVLLSLEPATRQAFQGRASETAAVFEPVDGS